MINSGKDSLKSQVFRH